MALVLLELASSFFSNGLRIPFYNGDAVWALALIKGAIRGDWFPFGVPSSSFAGAPFGFKQIEFPEPNGVFYVIINFISIFTRDPALVMKLFYASAFALSAAFFAFLARQFRVDWWIAIVLGALYAILPYHFVRTSHLFLGSYFFVPLFVLVCLWIWHKRPIPFASRRKFWLTLAICAIAGGGGVYYAFFFCFFALVSSVGAAFYRRSWNHLLAGLLVTTLVATFTVANILPYTWMAYRLGKSGQVINRDARDTEVYGLKMTRMLLPRADHRIKFLGAPSRAYSSVFPYVEGDDEPIGLVATVGLLIVLCSFLFLKRGTGTSRLGLFSAVGLLYFTVTGGAGIFSLLITGSIRSVNRVSVFIAAFALLGLAFALQKLRAKMIARGWHWRYRALLIMLLIAGYVDQAAPGFANLSPYSDLYLSDEEFFGRVNAQDDQKQGAVFQLPFEEFPEGYPPGKMDYYGHFVPYIHTDGIKWSYPAVRGRPEAYRISEVSKLPVPELLKQLSLMNFTGIYMDRRGYGDGGASLESQLAPLLGAPMVSRNGMQSFFSMKDYANRLRQQSDPVEWRRLSHQALGIVRVAFSRGFFGPEGDGKSAWSRKQGKIEIVNSTPEDQTVNLSWVMKTQSSTPTKMTLRGPLTRETVMVSSAGVEFKREISVPPGPSVWTLQSEAEPWISPLDPRPRYFLVEGLSLVVL